MDKNSKQYRFMSAVTTDTMARFAEHVRKEYINVNERSFDVRLARYRAV